MSEPADPLLLKVTRLREVTALLRLTSAQDRKLIAEEAMAAWLDTVAPESRAGALEAWIQRMRFRVGYGQ